MAKKKKKLKKGQSAQAAAQPSAPVQPTRPRQFYDQDAPRAPRRSASTNLTGQRPVRTRVEPPARLPRENATHLHVDSVETVSSLRRAEQKRRRKENERRSKKLAKEQKKLLAQQKREQTALRKKKISRIRRGRRRKKNRVLYYLLALIVMLAAGTILSTTVFFQIQTVSVEGTSLYSAEELAAYGEVELGDNLFRINPEQIRQRVVEKCTALDSVQVRRKLPNTLSFVCEEAQAKYAAVADNQIFILSSAGRIIATTASLENYTDVVFLSGLELSGAQIGAFVEQEAFETLLTALQGAQSAGIGDIYGAAVSGVEVTLNYQDRLTIVLGNVLDLDYKFSLVKEVLENQIGTSETGRLDASIEGKVTFRPMPLSEQSAELYELAQIKTQGALPAAESTADASSEAAQETAETSSEAASDTASDTTSDTASETASDTVSETASDTAAQAQP